MDKKCSFVPKNVHLVLKKLKIVLFTLKMKFLPKNFNKMYKFWMKTVVLYPKMYIWSWNIKKIVLFTLKIKFLQNNFTKMYKFWIKTVVLYPKMYIWSWKIKEIVLFTLKLKFLTKNLTKMYKFWIKTVVLYTKNVHLVLKKQKNFTFYSKNEVSTQKFH